MSALEEAIALALDTVGENKHANKAYLEFIKANAKTDPEVLFLQEEGHTLLPVFTNMNYLSAWAHEIGDHINTLQLSGVDLLKGIGDEVTVCLDIATPHYKEFNPAEIARMRSIVLKLFKN